MATETLAGVRADGAGVDQLLSLLSCPGGDPRGKRCGGELSAEGDGLTCETCGTAFPIRDGIMVLRPIDPADFESRRYADRDRTKELEQGWYAPERAFLTKQIAALGATGPTLDLGCGNGLLASALPGYIGLEYDYSALTSNGWEDLTRVCGDGQRLPFRDGSLGLAVSVNCIEHIPDPGAVFAELDRVLRPGGHLMLCPAWHCSRVTTELLTYKRYDQLNLRQKLTKAMLPVTQHKAYKLMTWIPKRGVRRLTTGRGERAGPLKWTPLTPAAEAWDASGKYILPVYIPDTDAHAGIDCHEAILYFLRRGYRCHSHPGVARQLLAGHAWVVLQKRR